MYSADELGILGGVDWEIPLSNPNKIRRLVDAMNYYEMEYCWFDVLCMPQDRQGEINLEIPFMSDYYNGSDITFVLSDIEYTISEDFWKWHGVMSNVTDPKDLTPDEDSWMLSESRDLLNFHEDPWFRRMWTFQEAVLSRELTLVTLGGSYINLSDIINKLSHLVSGNVNYADNLFRSSPFLLDIIAVMRERRERTLDLAKLLTASGNRDCHRIHDRFYAMLGILDYRDFMVDYDIDMNDLNRKIAQHAHLRGDVSWMGVGGYIGGGFVQPMYMPFSYIGIDWRQSVATTIINDTLYMEAAELGQIVRCDRFTESGGNFGDIVSWMIRTFRDWELDDGHIFSAMAGHINMSEELVHIGISLVDTISGGMSLEDAIANTVLLLPEGLRGQFGDITRRIILLDEMREATITRVENHPLIVSGNADVGDKIVATRMRDGMGRILGIVATESRRKGIFLLPNSIHLVHPVSHDFFL
jgi:hypothetical protein